MAPKHMPNSYRVYYRKEHVITLGYIEGSELAQPELRKAFAKVLETVWAEKIDGDDISWERTP